MEMNLETNAAGKQEVLASGSRGKPLVARTWFGRTRREFADEYLRYVDDELAGERRGQAC
jgi:hypothetical protein